MTPLVSPKTSHQSRHHLRSSSPSYFGFPIDHIGSRAVRSSGPATVHDGMNRAQYKPTHHLHPPRSAADQNPSPRSPQHSSHKNTRSLDWNDTPAFPRRDIVAGPCTAPVDSVKPASVHGKSSAATPRSVYLSSKDSNALTKLEFPQSRSPKRLLSHDSAISASRSRCQSSKNSQGTSWPTSSGIPSRGQREDKHPRLSVSRHSPYNQPDFRLDRSEVLPAMSDPPGPSMVTAQDVVSILESFGETVLLLDLRVSTQFAKSRISGALNLCIPTTLLKRPSFTVQKLAETFKDDDQRARFDTWRASRYIIAYDTSSSQLKDAIGCVNLLRKFSCEGWTGKSCIIRGGFADFARKFPHQVDEQSSSSDHSFSPGTNFKSNQAELPPVVGGCPLPSTKNPANPFFGNIRQNMDLIGGVGQMAVSCPEDMSNQMLKQLPRWLLRAIDDKDNGKAVSDKFYQIEKREQKRMQEALSANVVYNASQSAAQPKRNVQIAGIEKGGKNRYNNIWPYEHSRVKLKGVSPEGCDYVNANFLGTSISAKRYIATQGPIPATFADFWSMVWQRDVRVIVMLTAETEGGQIKAHNYWNGRNFGPIQLGVLSEKRIRLEDLCQSVQARRRTAASRQANHGEQAPRERPRSGTDQSPTTSLDCPFVIVRKFVISHSEQPFERLREITHLQYSSWPDFGAPTHPAHLLGLVDQCNSVLRSLPGISRDGHGSSPERPTLVHCSAGCGRTGTFCTVDSVVDALKFQMSRTPRREDRHTSPIDPVSDSANGPPTANPFFARTHEQPGWDQKDGQGSQSRGEHDQRSIDEEIDLVERAVEEFRMQRVSMVQTLRQFVLCYETVLEWVACHGAQ